jgi:hypothetical protein
MAHTGIQHYSKVPGGRPRCGATLAICSGPVLSAGSHWCRRCRPNATRSNARLTESDWQRIVTALRLRAEAAEENGDAKAASEWRETLAKSEAHR